MLNLRSVEDTHGGLTSFLQRKGNVEECLVELQRVYRHLQSEVGLATDGIFGGK